jgi:GAF domain-containing protein
MAAVYDLAHAANRQSDLATMLSILLGRAARATGASGGTIFLVEPADELKPIVSLPALTDDARGISFSRESARKAVETGAPVTSMETWIGDTAATRQRLAVVYVPLVTPGGTTGVLFLISARGRKFSHRHTEFLKSLCSEAALAIENARLRSELQRLAVTDHLTGLPDRRAVEAHLIAELASTRRGAPGL